MKVKVRSNKVTKWKCCMSVVRHMFFGSFGRQNLMVAFIFMFCLRKGQYQVKSGQIRSNFQIQNFLTEACLFFPVLSQDFKNVIYFTYSNKKAKKLKK